MTGVVKAVAHGASPRQNHGGYLPTRAWYDVAVASTSYEHPLPGRGGCGPDQQVEDSHLGDPVAAPGELLPDRSYRRPVPVQVALVAADELERTLPERNPDSGVVVL